MKKILLISRCPPYPLHLGDRLIIWHLARELAARGYTIDLLALYNQADDPDFLAEYAPFFRNIELFPETPRRQMDFFKRLIIPSARFAESAGDSFSPDLWQAIQTALQDEAYDLVHCFGGISVYEFYPLFAHLPNLITPYESYSLYLQRMTAQQGGLSTRIQQAITSRFESWMFMPYDRTVVIAQADKDALLQLNPNLKIEVIANGIDLNHFVPQNRQREAHTLLFVGNYEYAPNLDAVKLLVDEILPRVRQQIPSARLLLVGNAPPDWMRDLAKDFIEVTGRVPDVADYLASATLFVCPLRMGAGLKNKVLEALAMGMSIVATPLSVDGIAVEHGQSAWISDVDSMADSIVHLLKNPDLQQKLSRNARALIESQYSWSQTATHYETLYDSICKSRMKSN